MSMTDTTGTQGGRARFEAGGWVNVWHALYLATLSAATIAAVLDDTVEPGQRVGITILAVAGAGWYLLIVIRWRYWQAPPLRFALLLSVAAILWILLIRWHSAFGWTVFAAYGVAACPWLRRAVPTVITLTTLLAVLDHTDGSALTFGELIALIAVGAVVLLAHATIGTVVRESERRRVLIAELESTRAELAEREHQAGALEERQRLARDIHDGLAQGFTSIVTLLEAADARLPTEAVDARAAIDQARQAARDSLSEARRLVWALRDEQDPPGALPAALDRLAERTRAGTDTTVDVVTTGTPDTIDPTLEVTVLRTAQEAVANAARHARATNITITVSWLGDHVILDVADNGCGFDPDRLVAPPRKDGSGFGLTSLRERADSAGASLDIDSVPGEGTTLTLTLPISGSARPSRYATDEQHR